MSPRLLGLGTALPPWAFDQEQAFALLERLAPPPPERTRTHRAILRRSGVRRRHSAVHGDPAAAPAEAEPATTAARMIAYAERAPALALAAAGAALADAALPARALTHLVTVSCTGFGAPGVDLELLAALGMAPTVERTHVGFMGCHGALNGLRVARALAAADPGARVLVVAVELCTLHLQPTWSEDDAVANALFADGAAAAVVAAADASRAREAAPRLAATGAALLPDSRDAMSWRIGDHGFRMHLSPRVPDLVGRHVGPWLDAWLGAHGLQRDAVAHWAIHPGGPRILAEVGAALGLGADALAASTAVLRECGNMSSPTVLFILERLRRAGADGPTVALAFGPGLAAETLLLV